MTICQGVYEAIGPNKHETSWNMISLQVCGGGVGMQKAGEVVLYINLLLSRVQNLHDIFILKISCCINNLYI